MAVGNTSRREFLKVAAVGAAASAVIPEASAATVPGAAKPTSAPTPQVAKAPAGYLKYANPMQGTNSTPQFSRGNTLPILAMPFGMAHWALQSTSPGPWFFRPADRRIEGIRSTHQLSPWLSDYGSATFLPVFGEPSPSPGARASSYRPEETEIYPHHLRLNLLRYGCTMEFVPADRGGILRATFDQSGPAALMIDLRGADPAFQTEDGNTIVTARTTENEGGVPEGFATYYVIHFDQPLTAFKAEDVKGRQPVKVGIASFAATAGKPIDIRIAHSFISFEQAHRNLKLELANKPFEAVLTAATEVWEKQLSRIAVEGGTETQNRTFYSALYRASLFPRIWHEPDASGNLVHYSPYNGKVEPGVMYADHGYWDVYRAWYPFMSLFDPQRLGEILQAWVNVSKEGGWLPQFPCPGYRACMTGSLIDSVFGEAAAKEIQGYDIQTAYAALKRHATSVGDTDKGYGRRGVEEYMKNGYISTEHVEQSAVETLDSAYGDYCIAQVARAAGHTDDAAMFEKRSQNWRNIFDPKTKFMRGKTAEGKWAEPFNPLQWGTPYVEGGAWQHRFSVPHDLAGLIEASGGAAPFVKNLDASLEQEPRFEVGVYGQEIHEMSEMAAVHFGQYAHSNQPSHHILYLYAAAGRPDRTQYWVRRVLDELYSPDNYAGDEDTGSMAAWYILSSLGIYSVCPAKPEYTLGSPLFTRATVSLQNGKKIVIESRNNGPKQVYVKSLLVNGKPHREHVISHKALAEGASLAFDMADKA